MGFINREKIDLPTLKIVQAVWLHESFWGHVEQPVVTMVQPSQPGLGFLGVQGGVQKSGGNAIYIEGVHLILHECNQW